MKKYIKNEDINLNFNGLEMRQLGDEISVIRSNFFQESLDIDTKYDIPISVYVQSGKKSTPLVTFHDIGTNHNSFINFFNCAEMSVILENFTVYNVCAPGHQSHNSMYFGRSSSTEENFRLLPKGKSTGDSQEEIYNENGDIKPRISVTYPTMDELAEMVDSVSEHFQLKCFLAMGVGAGSNVMARYGIKHPSKLLGLILINPDDTTSGYYQWTKARWADLPQLRKGSVTDWLENYLLGRWFGSITYRNLDLQEYYLQLLRELNHVAAAGYIETYMNRTALGLMRPLGDIDTVARSIDVETLLITGEFATDLARAMHEMNGNMNPSKTQFLSVPECSGMVLEDAPGKMANIFLNFLRNLGIMITMTPEKLQLAVAERQTGKMNALSEVVNR